MSLKNYARNELHHTKEYALFNPHENNRPLREKPILEASMRAHGFMPSSPIQVRPNGSGQFIIIRGHHRFEYAKRLGLPVYFVIDSSNTDLFHLESIEAQGWSADDFARARANAGNAALREVVDYAQRHDVSVRIAAMLLGGKTAHQHSGNHTEAIRRGTFTLAASNLTHAMEVAAVVDLARASQLKFATSSAFVAAVSAALHVPELNRAQLHRRIRDHSAELRKRSTRDDYLEELENVYNRHSKGPKLALKLRAREELKRRDPGRRGRTA